MSYHAGAGKPRQKKAINSRLLNGLLSEVRGHNKVGHAPTKGRDRAIEYLPWFRHHCTA